MQFFDPKEEVLDVKLTNYGRSLLAKGRWKPAFYAFMDENVLYDSKCAPQGGFVESKNDAEGRIQEETPLLKTQGNFTGREENLYDGENDIVDQIRIEGYEKFNVMPFTLGNSALDSTKTPAIRIQFLQGELKDLQNNSTGSLRVKTTDADPVPLGTTTNSHQILQIPQLELDVEYKITVADAENPEVKFTTDPALTPGNVYSDDSIVVVGPEQILMVVEEANSPFEFENFEIEVFEITDELDAFGEPIKNQLNFIKPLEMVENNILIDKEEAELKAGRLNGALPEINKDFVSYYFDVNVDSEVDESIICKSVVQISNSGKSLFTDIDLKCPDVDPSFIAPIYATDAIDEDCPDY